MLHVDSTPNNIHPTWSYRCTDRTFNPYLIGVRKNTIENQKRMPVSSMKNCHAHMQASLTQYATPSTQPKHMLGIIQWIWFYSPNEFFNHRFQIVIVTLQYGVVLPGKGPSKKNMPINEMLFYLPDGLFPTVSVEVVRFLRCSLLLLLLLPPAPPRDILRDILRDFLRECPERSSETSSETSSLRECSDRSSET